MGDFGYTPDGSLVFRREKNDGNVVAEMICSHPIYIERLSRGEHNQDVHNISFCYKPPHEDWRTTHVPMKTMFGQAGISEIMGRGIVVHDADLFRKFVRESVDKINHQQQARVMFQQFGWKDDDTAFLFGPTLYRRGGATEPAFGSEDLTKRTRYIGPAPRGKFSIWREAIDKLFAPGFEPQALAFLASCAAPLMRLQSHMDGGSVLSFVSREGGTGKSTALAAASSVWGRNLGMELKLHDTRISKGIVLSVMGNLPLIIDEFTQRDPEMLKEWIEIFTGGRDKLRGTPGGGLIDLGMEWQTILISGSNSSVVDALHAAKNGGPMSTRVIEFIMEKKKVDHSKGDQLKDALDANSGFAGDRLVRYLLQPEVHGRLSDDLQRLREGITKTYSLQSTDRYRIRLLAAVGVIAPIVRHLDLATFSADRVMEWAANEIVARARADITADETNANALARFIDEHQDCILAVDGPWTHSGRISIVHRAPHRKVLMRTEEKGKRIFIQHRALQMWLQKEQIPWREMVKDLMAKGIIVSEKRTITLGAGTSYGYGQTPVVELDGANPTFSGLKDQLFGPKIVVNNDAMPDLQVRQILARVKPPSRP